MDLVSVLWVSTCLAGSLGGERNSQMPRYLISDVPEILYKYVIGFFDLSRDFVGY